MLASLSKKIESLSNSKVGQTVSKVISNPYAQGTFVASATGLGLFLTGNGEILLNAVDATITPFVGSLANNVYAQAASLVLEASAAAAAIKSTVWTVSRVRQTTALEKENAKLKTDIEIANVEIKNYKRNENATEESADKNVKAALENKIRAKELADGFKKLKTQTASLKRKENTLENNKEQLKADRAALSKDEKALAKKQEALAAAKKAETTKSHNNAKKEKELNTLEASLNKKVLTLDAREKALKDQARANEDLRSELEALRLELDEALEQLQNDQAALKDAQEQFEAEKELSSDSEAPQLQQRSAREVLLSPTDAITLEKRDGGKPVLTGYDQLRARQNKWDVKPESDEEVVRASDNDEVSSHRSRSPSPHRH